ncbi:MAG: hypothetical protein A07HR67_01199 [uncultured archaeon A07HR67]|nr:MAG: hypothetical protein A07HR67_01199 [uncultured archaeon A07HR67]
MTVPSSRPSQTATRPAARTKRFRRTPRTRKGQPAGDPIEWGPVRHERLRSVAVGAGMAVAVPVAVGALVVAVFAAETAVTAAAGGTGLGDAWVAIVLLLVGGPFSLVYLLIANDRSTLAARERIRSAVDDYAPPRDAIRLGWVIAGAVLVGAVFAFGPSPADVGVFVLFPLVWMLPAIVGGNGTVVRLDPNDRVVERTARSNDRVGTDDLESVVRIRRIDLPWTTVFLLAYRGNAWYRSIPWLFVPTTRADAVETALEAIVARSDGPDRASLPERALLALLGSGSLVVGTAMTAAGAGGGGLALTVASAPFSLLFFALAARL